MIRATTFAGCAEKRKFHKMGIFVHFGETGDSPNTFNFYFQHNTKNILEEFESHVEKYQLGENTGFRFGDWFITTGELPSKSANQKCF